MPATQATTVIARPFTGDYRKDVLIDDITYRWNAASPVGTAVTVSYAFMTASPSYANAVDKNGFSVFTDAEKVATRAIFDQLSKVLNITFVEVADTALGSGIRLGNNVQTNTAGYAKLPQPTADGTALQVGSGDLYMASNTFKDLSFTAGTAEYKTLIHEIGHALGLNHPGNYDAFEPPIPNQPGNFLATSEDTTWVSIMSYYGAAQGQQRDFFGTYDLLTLKYLYGTKATNTGDNTYAYADTDGSILKIINDNGGNDTIDVSKVSTPATINLTPGSNNSFGLASNGAAAINNLQTAFDATVENVIGTAQADTITGNDADNTITGGGGNDVIDGGKGTDTAVYAGARANYTLTKTSSTAFTAKDKVGTDGTDTLSNVEKLKFSDMTINLQVGDQAKTITSSQLQSIIELYIAYFNRAPDADGMSYWITQFKAGTSLESIGNSFYAAAVSPSFTALTGFSSTSTNTDFIGLIYKNVLGRSTPDQAGLDYWNANLANGSQTRGSLINTILVAAHGYKGQATLGAVADLLDNKFTVGKTFAIDQGITYNSATESYSKGQAVSAAVTATDTTAAIKLIGVADTGFTLS